MRPCCPLQARSAASVIHRPGQHGLIFLTFQAPRPDQEPEPAASQSQTQIPPDQCRFVLPGAHFAVVSTQPKSQSARCNGRVPDRLVCYLSKLLHGRARASGTRPVTFTCFLPGAARREDRCMHGRGRTIDGMHAGTGRDDDGSSCRTRVHMHGAFNRVYTL